MKIVILSRYQDISERGAEVFVKELVSHLDKSMDIKVLSGEDSDNLAKVLSLKPDIVIPINGRMQSLKASLGRLSYPYKVIISGHSGIGRDDLWNLFTRPNIFVALTKAMQDWALPRSLGVRIEKIPNGVDIDKFNPKGPKLDLKLPHPIILSVGALTYHKHHERAIKAVAGLKQGSLLIVGKGEEKNSLLRLGRELLGERFNIRSFNYSQMPDLYRSVDVFTLPSWDREAFGIVYLEALASGIPIVAPLDASRREIIGEAGILVNVEDIARFKEALQDAVDKNWAKSPRNQAERFSWTKIAANYQHLFEEVTRQ